MNNIMVVLKTNNYSDVPRLLLEKITSDEAGDFFEQFTQKDQGNDMLRDFFQERYAARKDLKQDYTSRQGHKLKEWHEFIEWIEGLPYNELIRGEKHNEIGQGVHEKAGNN